MYNVLHELNEEQEVVESVFLIIYNKKLFFDEQEVVETCTRRDFFFR